MTVPEEHARFIYRVADDHGRTWRGPTRSFTACSDYLREMRSRIPTDIYEGLLIEQAEVTETIGDWKEAL